MRPTTYKSLEDRSKKPHIEVTLAEQIAPILAGRGHPPITQQDVLALAGIVAPTHNPSYHAPPPFNARVEKHGAAVAIISQDVPVVPASHNRWGVLAVMLGAPPVAWLPRPPTLAANRDVFAVTIQDASLSPRFDPGERVYCDPTRPPSVGAYAVAITHDRNGDGAQLAIAGRVDAISATSVTIAQLQPATSINVPTSNIATLARILTTAELLGT